LLPSHCPLCIIPPHPNSQSVIKNQLQAAMDGIGSLFRLAMDMGADTTGSCLPKKFGSLAAPTNRAVTGEPLANQHADATPHCIDLVLSNKLLMQKFFFFLRQLLMQKLSVQINKQ